MKAVFVSTLICVCLAAPAPRARTAARKARLVAIPRSSPAATGPSARHTAEKFGFAQCGTDSNAVFTDASVDLVFIATQHDSHAPLAEAALRAGKAVAGIANFDLTATLSGSVGYTKAGNGRVRRALIESAWSYRHLPRTGKVKHYLLERVSPAVRAIAAKAQARLKKSTR